MRKSGVFFVGFVLGMSWAYVGCEQGLAKKCRVSVWCVHGRGAEKRERQKSSPERLLFRYGWDMGDRWMAK